MKPRAAARSNVPHLRAVFVAVMSIASAFPGFASPQGKSGALRRWDPLWTREPKAGQVAVDPRVHREGRRGPSIRVEHRGAKDWSLGRRSRVAVRGGDVLEFGAWVQIRGRGRAIVSVVTYDRDGEVLHWQYGLRAATAGEGVGWQHLHSRVIVPVGVAEVLPRLTGEGPATVWMQDFAFEKKGDIRALRASKLPEQVIVRNGAITVVLHTADATLSVRQRTTGASWRQRSDGSVMVLRCRRRKRGWTARLLHTLSAMEFEATLQLEGERPEFTVALRGKGALAATLAFPHPFASGRGTHLVVPLNEGISYPVDDEGIPPMRLIAYGGHGICMAFWGVTDGQAAHMAIFETPDDAVLHIRRIDGRLCGAPQWVAQRGEFGGERRLRYVFFESGGHVAMCKRYRAHARERGLLKTLAEKRARNPNVDRLVGAVNIWCWESAAAILPEVRAAGIERILWSHREAPAILRAMNELGVLTSRYDIYQDVMDPAQFGRLRGVHPDWPSAAWPRDLMLDERGAWRRGWQVEARDGRMIACGVLCDELAPAYADERIGKELQTHPYRCRFIDTTTASPWRECYSSEHPMTRSESRHWKMELLRLVSEKYHLVCGSETGHDAAVPYVHYFEGMLSLGPYRVPGAGRNMQKLWREVPPRVAEFQLGHAYRLPLWELVYHDCVVAQWYWGDYSNKLPSLWDKRDLFNILYGTPPMFMFNRDVWNRYRDRFVESYRKVCPIARATGYREMTDHRFLTPDRAVQQTVFAGGITITVNFGAKAFRLEGGEVVGPMGFAVAGIRPSPSGRGGRAGRGK